VDHVLEKWYNDKLYATTPQQAKSLLIKVLEDSKVPPNYIEEVKKSWE